MSSEPESDDRAHALWHSKRAGVARYADCNAATLSSESQMRAVETGRFNMRLQEQYSYNKTFVAVGWIESTLLVAVACRAHRRQPLRARGIDL